MNKNIVKKIMALTLAATISMSGMTFAAPSQVERLEFMNEMINYVDRNFKGDVDSEKLMNSAFDGIFEATDKYSEYYTSEEYKSFTDRTSGVFGGVGITIQSESGYLRVVSPIDGTPGARSGIRPGDMIVEVNGEDIKDQVSSEVIKKIKGEPGTDVILGIRREGEFDVINFTITREIIVVHPVEAEIIEGNIGYIKLKEFNDNSAKDFQDTLLNQMNKDIKGLVIDLRNNPGGSLQQVLEIADFFVPEGEAIVRIDYQAKTDRVYNSEMVNIKIPLVVLVNEGSASASEILASAIQDNKTGIIVGTKSYGKGTVQSVTDMGDYGAFKLTVAEYLSSGNNKINGIGVIPDVVIKNPEAEDKESARNFAPMVEDIINKLGDTGLNIYGAQQRLKFLGYSVKADGKLGEKTQDAIKSFQESRDIEVTGTLDYNTRRALQEEAANVYADGTEDAQMAKAIELLKNRIK